MSATPTPIDPAHLERAYAQLQRPGWPSLAELRSHYVLYGLLRARASALAHGQGLPSEPLASAAAQAPA